MLYLFLHTISCGEPVNKGAIPSIFACYTRNSTLKFAHNHLIRPGMLFSIPSSKLQAHISIHQLFVSKNFDSLIYTNPTFRSIKLSITQSRFNSFLSPVLKFQSAGYEIIHQTITGITTNTSRIDYNLRTMKNQSITVDSSTYFNCNGVNTNLFDKEYKFGSALYSVEAEHVLIKDCHFQKCYTNFKDASGGAIYLEFNPTGTLILMNNIFTECQASGLDSDGGAIYAINGQSAELKNNAFSNCTALRYSSIFLTGFNTTEIDYINFYESKSLADVDMRIITKTNLIAYSFNSTNSISEVSSEYKKENSYGSFEIVTPNIDIKYFLFQNFSSVTGNTLTVSSYEGSIEFSTFLDSDIEGIGPAGGYFVDCSFTNIDIQGAILIENLCFIHNTNLSIYKYAPFGFYRIRKQLDVDIIDCSFSNNVNLTQLYDHDSTSQTNINVTNPIHSSNTQCHYRKTEVLSIKPISEGPASTDDNSVSDVDVGLVVGCVVAAIVFILLVVLIIYCIKIRPCCQRHAHESTDGQQDDDVIGFYNEESAAV